MHVFTVVKSPKMQFSQLSLDGPPIQNMLKYKDAGQYQGSSGNFIYFKLSQSSVSGVQEKVLGRTQYNVRLPSTVKNLASTISNFTRLPYFSNLLANKTEFKIPRVCMNGCNNNFFQLFMTTCRKGAQGNIFLHKLHHKST